MAAEVTPVPIIGTNAPDQLTRQALEREEALLSSLLCHGERVGDVQNETDLAPQDFTDPANGCVFSAIVDVVRDERAVDPIRVAQELERLGQLQAIGGRVRIGELLDTAPEADARSYAKDVKNDARRRQLAGEASRLAAALTDPRSNSSDLVAAFAGKVDALLRHSERCPAIAAIDVADVDPAPFLIDDLLVVGEIALVAGESGGRKTTVMMALAGAVAGGYPVFGRFNCRASPVLFVTGEDSKEVLGNRLRAFVAGHGWDADRVMNNVFILEVDDGALTDAAFRALLTREVIRIGAGLLVIDPLSDMLGSADESSNSDWRPIARFLRGLARRTGVVPLLIHHFGKAGERPRPLADRVRGASAYIASARCVLLFRQVGMVTTIVHHKMSRAPKLPDFDLVLDVAVDSEHRARWTSATLHCATRAEVDDQRSESAEALVLRLVSESPRKLSSSGLKAAARGTGVTAISISQAIAALQKAGSIAFEPGPRGAHFWYPTTLPSISGKLSAATLPTLPTSCPARSRSDSDHLAAPFTGAGIAAARRRRRAKWVARRQDPDASEGS